MKEATLQSKIAQVEEVAAKMEIPVEKVQQIQKIAQDPVSLESPVGEEDESKIQS